MKCALFFFILMLPFTSFAEEILSTEENALIQKGEMVKRVKWKKGFAWPEVTIIAVIPYTPIENMAVFSDYESHKDFIPDMNKSKIVAITSPKETQVKFTMKMQWPINTSTYTTNNIIEKTTDQEVVLKWNLVKADLIKDTYGSVVFTAKDGKTIFCYTNQIVPDSVFARMFKGRVEGDVERSVQKIIEQLRNKLNQRSPETEKRISDLKALL